MGKLEINKKLKQNSLYQAAFDLFTNKGFAKTTISDIVKKAELAKGTFYLYFEDKYELRDKLIARKAGQLFLDAYEDLIEHPVSGFENQILRMIDYIVEYLRKNHMLLQFISKNLSWGILKNAFEKTVPDETQQFYEYYLELMKKSSVVCRQPELMLFTIVELTGATCYSCILHDQPVSMEEYLPYLHRSVHEIIRSFTESDQDVLIQTDTGKDA